MRYAYLVAFATLLAMPFESTLAEEPTPGHGLETPRSPDCRHLSKNTSPCRQCQPLPAGVFCEGGPVRFKMVHGRLEVDPMRYRKGSEEHHCARLEENISVSASSGIPAVYYSYRDSYQSVRLTAEYKGVIRIESMITATGEQGELIQPVDGPILFRTRRITDVASNLNEACTGPTLLHIVGQDEDGFSVHLESILARILRGRSVTELTRRTENYLRQNTHLLSTVSRDQVNDLVDQMKSTKSAHRRAAVRELASYGSCVVPLLRSSLTRNDLDAEQRARIQSLLASRTRVDEDTPSSLAQLLAVDREHWQILAKRMDQSQWLVANDHVMRCGLESLSP